jgi:hypothetical protein
MTERSSAVDALRRAHDAVLERIAAAAGRRGRDPAEITLIAVSKTVEPARLRQALAAGISTFGENRVQEGLAKQRDVIGARWELIGPLQSNKARKAIEGFARIQTIDTVALAERLDRLSGEVRPGQRYPVLVQVNVDRDPAKSGFLAADVEESAERILDLPNLRVQGLMTVGHLAAEPETARHTFRGLRELSERLRTRDGRLGPELSMGMTDDFEIAIEEGATIVRIGRAIFGERPHHHGDGAVEHAH